MVIAQRVKPLKIGDEPRECAACGDTLPTFDFPLGMDGIYGPQCYWCLNGSPPADKPHKDATKTITWARGSREHVALTTRQIDRIILLGAFLGYQADTIQEVLGEANEAVLSGRGIIL